MTKKLIDWDIYQKLMFGPADECEECEHVDGCFCQDVPHKECPIWASLEDAETEMEGAE